MMASDRLRAVTSSSEAAIGATLLETWRIEITGSPGSRGPALDHPGHDGPLLDVMSRGSSSSFALMAGGRRGEPRRAAGEGRHTD